MNILETQRLILRTFEEHDLDAMAAIDQDPKVCEYLPRIGNREATYGLMQRIMKHYQEKGFSLYAVVLKTTGEMIGFLGLITPSFEAHFTPTVEIGWRLSSKHWNKGYATEGAKAVLHYAFTELNLPQIVSFTTVNNQASRRVMEKIGLRHNSLDDFDHPKLENDSPLKRHVLYRLSRADYLKNK
ncbi:GNAT family N-acetyltransferase [Legionella pneumophila serogroup 1]|uniref:GNAT family N-acetyltransferase n=1 Tax=Legionella pneumophila TaxID=446 RepID=UPI0001E3C67D|nr:GNAT family N-acetyltransferase [Legionella pneumophila]HAT9038378.1 GNAT family N-acetyltransferase [Legionella pneumophila subsp. pneumophila]TIE29230.1 N-acetyltransferase [Legionella pneumophila]TIE50735.1 N-acetyltransferase [Legionella pneumophila]CZG80240.1 Putative succinyl-CoA transferase Rv0802c [Legionella pneumophila]BCZ97697.1 N-acetyltransferase [Legionella pneumophila]